MTSLGRFLKYAVGKQVLIRPAAPDISSQFETISYSTRILVFLAKTDALAAQLKHRFSQEKPIFESNN